MVNTLALRVEDRGLDLRSGLTKGYAIGICFFSVKHATFWSKSKDGVVRPSVRPSVRPTDRPTDQPTD
jgi:hypothetical protein